MWARPQTQALQAGQISSSARAGLFSQRVGSAMENPMYIGAGALLLIILLILFLR
jgi:hypothetical protein